jgi:hypothetical protein
VSGAEPAGSDGDPSASIGVAPHHRNLATCEPQKERAMAAVLPDFDPPDFTPREPIDNAYFPLTPGTVFTFSGQTPDGEVESNDVLVTGENRQIAGVTATVVRDTAYLDGVLVEDTFDWYAQDHAGNVWYLGELTFAYDSGEEGPQTDTEGSWEAGVEIDPEGQPGVAAAPGLIMPSPEQLQAFLASGEAFFQEFAPGIAEDQAEVTSLGETVTVNGVAFADVLRTSETTALEPNVADFKYYAPGVGQVRTEETEEGEVVLTVDLQSIRSLAEAATDPLDQPERSDVRGDGDALWVTLIASDGDDAIGAYEFSNGQETLGEGRILFANTEAAGSDDASAALEVPHNAGLGLFLVPDAGALAELGLDLSEFEEGGLVFTDPLDFGAASLEDGLAPLVSAGPLDFEAPVNLPEFAGDEDVLPLPIEVFHALDSRPDGINPLNPAAGVQAIDLEWEGSEEVTVLGFEDTRVTDPAFDGDFNDVVVAVSDDPLDANTVERIATDLGLSADTLLG